MIKAITPRPGTLDITDRSLPGGPWHSKVTSCLWLLGTQGKMMPTAVTQLVRLGGSEYKGVILWSLTWLYISLDTDLMSCGGGRDKAFSFAVCVRCVMSTPFLQLKEKKFQQKKNRTGGVHLILPFRTTLSTWLSKPFIYPYKQTREKQITQAQPMFLWILAEKKPAS